MEQPLSLAYSPCPNDTYIFYALTHGLIPGLDLTFDVTLKDVEALNQAARLPTYDISKLSFAAIGHLLNAYGLLHSGAALGKGCGPLIVARPDFDLSALDSRPIAVPGVWTTASLLLELYLEHPPIINPMIFDQIMPAIAGGQVDVGVIIHEGRFTYKTFGLECLVDLGQWWESQTALPIPLGGIAIRRDLPRGIMKRVDHLIHESITYAHQHPEEGLDYIRDHAQEMAAQVINEHIELYVNDFSLDLGSTGLDAIRTLFDMAIAKKIIPPVKVPFMAYSV